MVVLFYGGLVLCGIVSFCIGALVVLGLGYKENILMVFFLYPWPLFVNVFMLFRYRNFLSGMILAWLIWPGIVVLILLTDEYAKGFSWFFIPFVSLIFAELYYYFQNRG